MRRYICSLHRVYLLRHLWVSGPLFNESALYGLKRAPLAFLALRTSPFSQSQPGA